MRYILVCPEDPPTSHQNTLNGAHAGASFCHTTVSQNRRFVVIWCTSECSFCHTARGQNDQNVAIWCTCKSFQGPKSRKRPKNTSFWQSALPSFGARGRQDGIFKGRSLYLLGRQKQAPISLLKTPHFGRFWTLFDPFLGAKNAFW